MPAGYLIVQVDVKDTETYETYKAGTPAVIAKYDGEFIVRGGQFEAVEGAPPLGRVVVVKFPSYARAQEFYHSDDYKELLAIRLAASESRGIIIEGVD
jgi:uncharacterized protein (DUF1330 family)